MDKAGALSHEIQIEKLVYGGAGLGRLEGRVVLVPFVLPGERVRVAIQRTRRGLAEARLIEVLTPASERIPPSCPYFARCGGCQYQHAPYPFQLEQKRAILAEVFRRVGKMDPPELETIAGPPWEYRNRAQFHIERGRIGYFEHGSHRLCPLERCPIASPRLNQGLAALAEMLADRRFPKFLRALELFTDETAVQLNVLDTAQPLARWFFEWWGERVPSAAALQYRAGGEVYRVSPGAFFQVNRFLIEALLECALGEAAGETALDLYAGVGLFTLPLARRFQTVTAVESSARAARDLARNVPASVQVKQIAVDLFLRAAPQTPDFVLVDPPRAGLGPRVVRELLRLRPPRLAVVSCDPATLARDLAALLGGGYRIARCTLIDLFPQTAHIETVTQLLAGSA